MSKQDDFFNQVCQRFCKIGSSGLYVTPREFHTWNQEFNLLKLCLTISQVLISGLWLKSYMKLVPFFDKILSKQSKEYVEKL